MSDISLTSIKPEFREDPGAAALVRLINRCPYSYGGLTGGTAPILSFLRSIHCGDDTKLDMELLIKRVDSEDFENVLQVITFCRRVWDSPGISMYRVFIDERLLGWRLFRCFDEESEEA